MTDSIYKQAPIRDKTNNSIHKFEQKACKQEQERSRSSSFDNEGKQEAERTSLDCLVIYVYETRK